MTGLDPERHVIVEIAAIVTGPELEPLAEIERVVWQPDEALARMSPFVRDMHEKSGLLDRIRASKAGLEDAEKDVLRVVTEHCKFREGHLAGNSIYQDRRFLVRHMPLLEGYLHHRQIDVSTLKVLVQAFHGPGAEFQKTRKSHTALSDIRESLDELRHYKARFLSPG